MTASVSVLGTGDLTINDRKFAGSAQRRLKNWFMVHCSILHDFPIECISRYLKILRRQPGYRAGRSHGDFLVNLARPRHQLADAIRNAFAAEKRARTTPPAALVQSLLDEKFLNRDWIERF